MFVSFLSHLQPAVLAGSSTSLHRLRNWCSSHMRVIHVVSMRLGQDGKTPLPGWPQMAGCHLTRPLPLSTMEAAQGKSQAEAFLKSVCPRHLGYIHTLLSFFCEMASLSSHNLSTYKAEARFFLNFEFKPSPFISEYKFCMLYTLQISSVTFF